MADEDFYDDLVEALESNDADAVTRAETELRSRATSHPDDAMVQYLVGSAWDSAGREAEAMPAYRRAFAIGVDNLPEEHRPEIFLQAGSTLRNLKEFDEARTLFREGMDRFPDYRALAVFAALVEASAGDERAAMALLFRMTTKPEDGSLARFRRSLAWYVDDLQGTQA